MGVKKIFFTGRDMINNLFLRFMGICFIKPFPKHSIRFCKSYFKSKPINVIEIGTFKGINAKYILNNLNIKKIYLIDPYDKYTCQDNYKIKQITKLDLKKPKNQAHKILKKYNFGGKLNWIEEYSDSAVRKVPKADYIYLDGEHTYGQVIKDLENYYPKLRGFGIMAGHDIHIEGVLNAVQDFTRKKDLNFRVSGQDWWFIKNK